MRDSKVLIFLKGCPFYVHALYILLADVLGNLSRILQKLALNVSGQTVGAYMPEAQTFDGITTSISQHET